MFYNARSADFLLRSNLFLFEDADWLKFTFKAIYENCVFGEDCALIIQGIQANCE
jgi:hypothetical protein